MSVLFRELNQDRLRCIDVGARGGIQNHWKPYRTLIELDAFEPDPEACAVQQQAKRPNENWYPVALGPVSGTSKLYVLKKPSSSSLYPPNPAVMSVYSHGGYGELNRVVELQTLTFADFFKQHRRPGPNLLKLDTQGAELDIMKSMATENWKDLLAVQCEVEFVEAYLKQPLFHDVDAFMREQGFILFDLLVTRNYRAEGQREHHFLKKHLNIARNRRDLSARLTEGDAFYIRPPEQVLEQGDRNTVLKLFLILLIYRCLDEALWLAEAAAARKIVTAGESAELIAAVQAAAPKPALYQRNDRIGLWTRKLRKYFNIGRARKIEYWLDRSWDA
jgi:FkbM family methyltransferase